MFRNLRFPLDNYEGAKHPTAIVKSGFTPSERRAKRPELYLGPVLALDALPVPNSMNCTLSCGVNCPSSSTVASGSCTLSSVPRRGSPLARRRRARALPRPVVPSKLLEPVLLRQSRSASGRSNPEPPRNRINVRPKVLSTQPTTAPLSTLACGPQLLQVHLIGVVPRDCDSRKTRLWLSQ
jgi:hypothetical protein